MSHISDMQQGNSVVSFSRDMDFYRRRVERLRQSGQKEDALSLMRMTLEQDPSCAECALECTELLVEMGWPEYALRTMTDILVRSDGAQEGSLALAATLCSMGYFRAATTELMRYLTNCPEGMYRAQAASMMAAVAHGMTTHFAVDRNTKRFRRNVERVARQVEGRYLKRACREAKELADKRANAVTLSLVAAAHEQSGHKKLAQKAVRQALEFGEIDKGTLMLLARILARTGAKDEAEALVDSLHGIPLSPDEQRIYERVLCELERHEELLAILTPQLATNPTDRQLLMAAGVAYENLGQRAQAMNCWQRMLRVDPLCIPAMYYVQWDGANGQRVSYEGKLPADDMRALHRRLRKEPVCADVRLALNCGDDKSCMKALDAVQKLERAEQESILREFLLNPQAGGAPRGRALAILRELGIREGVYVLSPDRIEVTGQTQRRTPPMRYYRVLRRLAQQLDERFMQKWPELLEIWLDAQEAVGMAPEGEDVLACAMHILALAGEEETSPIELAHQYGVSLRKTMYTVQRIQRLRAKRMVESETD